MLVYWLDIIGTAVFAISGVLLAGKLRMDPFGVLVLGVVTAVGGGTIRDMALANGPVFWVKDPTDLVVAMVTSMLTILLVRHEKSEKSERPHRPRHHKDHKPKKEVTETPKDSE